MGADFGQEQVLEMVLVNLSRDEIGTKKTGYGHLFSARTVDGMQQQIFCTKDTRYHTVLSAESD